MSSLGKTPGVPLLEQRWQERGTGERGSILMLHSLGLDRYAFDALWRELPPSWRVACFDQLGHGEAAGAGEFGLDDLVNEAVLALDRLSGRGPLHLVGHSMGGAVAARAAALARRRVTTLALVATPASGLPVFVQRGRQALEQGMPAAVAETMARWFGARAAVWPDARDYAIGALRRMTPQGYAHAWNALASFDGYTALAGRLPPTLCVAAGEDISTPPVVLNEIAAALPSGSAWRVDIAGHGHLLPRTAPAALAAILQSHWLRDAPDARVLTPAATGRE